TPERTECVAHRWTFTENTLRGDIDATVSQLARSVAKQLETDVVEISVDRPLVRGGKCRHCGADISIDPIPISRFRRFMCPLCNWLEVVPGKICEILTDDITPRQACVPLNHYLRVNWVRDQDVLEAWM